MQNCLACPYDQHHNHCQDVLTHLCPVEYELRDLIGMRAKGEKKSAFGGCVWQAWYTGAAGRAIPPNQDVVTAINEIGQHQPGMAIPGTVGYGRRDGIDAVFIEWNVTNCKCGSIFRLGQVPSAPDRDDIIVVFDDGPVDITSLTYEMNGHYLIIIDAPNDWPSQKQLVIATAAGTVQHERTVSDSSETHFVFIHSDKKLIIIGQHGNLEDAKDLGRRYFKLVSGRGNNNLCVVSMWTSEHALEYFDNECSNLSSNISSMDVADLSIGYLIKEFKEMFTLTSANEAKLPITLPKDDVPAEK